MNRFASLLTIVSMVVLSWFLLFVPTTADGLGRKTVVEVDARLPKNSSSVFSVDNTTTYGVSWTQTQRHSAVTVSAYLTAQFGQSYGTAYLTTRIGPGTQPSDVLGRIDFEFTPFPFNDVPIHLFEGFDLPAGTYYLIVATDNTSTQQGWEVNTEPKVTTSRDAQFDTAWIVLGEAENVGDVPSRNLVPYFGGAPLMKFKVASER